MEVKTYVAVFAHTIFVAVVRSSRGAAEVRLAPSTNSAIWKKVLETILTVLDF